MNLINKAREIMRNKRAKRKLEGSDSIPSDAKKEQALQRKKNKDQLIKDHV